MCHPILGTLLKMRPHYSQSSRENATQSSDTSPLTSYKEVPPAWPGQGAPKQKDHLRRIRIPENRMLCSESNSPAFSDLTFRPSSFLSRDAGKYFPAFSWIYCNVFSIENFKFYFKSWTLQRMSRMTEHVSKADKVDFSKAWRKISRFLRFATVKVASILSYNPSAAVHIYDFHIFTTSKSKTLKRFFNIIP